jgi:hypothetical protein
MLTLVITSKDIMQRPSSAIALLLSQMYRIAICTQEPSRNVLIVTSKPPLRRRLRNFVHLAAAAAGARGLWAPAPWGQGFLKVFQSSRGSKAPRTNRIAALGY